MDSILEGLNPAQLEAVTFGAGPLLVVAGAGSGKTRVITRRVAWLVQQGLEPREILAITFTNKAAGEMRERVETLLQRGGTWVSTFHAFGARLLRMEHQAAGLPRDFTILDASDQLALVREVMEELGVPGRDRRPQDVLAYVSNEKNAGVVATAEDAAADDLYRRAFYAYQEALTASACVDFDDLLLLPTRLLETDEDLRLRVASRFRTVLVDEYQDTNALQCRLAKALVRDHGNVCATGDPDQSIYRWRGADIRNILEFERDFPGATVVKLEENYRSTNAILRAASSLIRHNVRRVERELWSALGEGEPVRVVEGASEADEADLVRRGVQDALREGFSPDEVAIFYRTNACSRPLEQALAHANVPYEMVGAVEFYERREIKDLLAYLRVVVNPRDELDLLRIVNVPARGIGAKTLAQLREAARADGRPLIDVLLEGGAGLDLRRASREALDLLAALLKDLMAMPRRPAAPLLEEVLKRTGYTRWLASGEDPLLEERLENVDELRRALVEYDAAGGQGLDEFLAETALLRSRKDLAPDVPRVTMMTLHSAKGLEFPIVFLAGLEEGMLPHSRATDDEGVEEERRLLYVGITRARRRLTLSYARSRTIGGNPYGRSIPSRFLRELGDDVTGRAEPRFDAGGGFAFEDGASYEPDFDADEPPFSAGDRVLHRDFGSGEVLRLSGFGPTAKVTVNFERHGTKHLILEYARLRKARP